MLFLFGIDMLNGHESFTMFLIIVLNFKHLHKSDLPFFFHREQKVNNKIINNKITILSAKDNPDGDEKVEY